MRRPFVELLVDYPIKTRVFKKGSHLRAVSPIPEEIDGKKFIVLLDDPREKKLQIGRHVKFV